jgi:hypothetical protein
MNCALVLMCRECRAVVADTLRTVGTFEDLGALAVEVGRGSALARSPSVSTCGSKDAMSGATYHAIHCRHCRAVLGRGYLAVPRGKRPELCRNGAITFDTSALSSYELGSGNDNATALPFLEGDDSSSSSSSSMQSREGEELRAELVKVQVSLSIG